MAKRYWQEGHFNDPDFKWTRQLHLGGNPHEEKDTPVEEWSKGYLITLHGPPRTAIFPHKTNSDGIGMICIDTNNPLYLDNNGLLPIYIPIGLQDCWISFAYSLETRGRVSALENCWADRI